MTVIHTMTVLWTRLGQLDNESYCVTELIDAECRPITRGEQNIITDKLR